MPCDIAIVGAGPVGGALACRLARAGFSVLVVDRAALPPMEHPDFDGRAYAIAAGSRPLLEAGGLWERLPISPGPIRHIRVSDGSVGRRASPLFLHWDVPGTESAMGWMVEARALRVALNSALADEPGITLRAPAAAAVERDARGALVRLSSGEAFETRLVVAAEGRDSPLRRQAGIAAQRWAYRQCAIVGAIAHERPHRQTALEHFLPAGPFAQLPLAPSEAGENLSAIVWTERADAAPRFAAMDDAAFGREIARRLGDHLGAVRPVGKRWLYPLGALYVHRLYATRLALAGDSAHGIHPIAGQGLNLGLRDAIALADLLIAARDRSEDFGSETVLRRYERARRPDIVSMLAATDLLDRLFSTNNPLIRAARGIGLAAINRTPSVKTRFMRQAMGVR